MVWARLQNYPVHAFETADEWSAFFSGCLAPTRVRVPSAHPISWSLRVASVQKLFVAYGEHASDIEIDQFGSGDGVHIHIPQSGRAELTVGGQTVVASTEQATMVDFSRPHRLKMQRSPGYNAIALNIPRQLVNEQFAAVNGQAPRSELEFEPTLGLASAPGRMLASTANALVTGLENGLLAGAPMAMTNLSQSLLSLLIQAGPHQFRNQTGNPVSLAAPRYVTRAIDFMQANIANPLSSAEIAAAANISVRSLEVGFQAFKNTTPMAYLRSIRLAAVRDELAMPNHASTIAEIAYRWGFAHLGRFSAIYRKAYGELPSETVARRRH